jgi:ergothioneine biosynthesis protein EgtB
LEKEELLKLFKIVRLQTEHICKSLKTEDYSVQPIVNVSPPKWHLAHSTWFFEQFVLVPYLNGYKFFDADFAYLFNSYYNYAGERVLRPNRGLMTRPTVDEVYHYRKYVSENMNVLLQGNLDKKLIDLVVIVINHEQQHQELLVYDIKYILGHQPTFPKYENSFQLKEDNCKQEFIAFKEGDYKIVHQLDSFCYDNELGEHKSYVQPFQISNKLVTNAEYIEFIEAGGYNNFNLWHAEGWDFIQKNNIKAPLYLCFTNGDWKYYNFKGLENVNPNLPVMHISYYEAYAYAYAEWKGMRLPTEFEWEVATQNLNWGDLWEWTASAYQPYPNFSKALGACIRRIQWQVYA